MDLRQRWLYMTKVDNIGRFPDMKRRNKNKEKDKFLVNGSHQGGLT